jgi:hypothetical protein
LISWSVPLNLNADEALVGLRGDPAFQELLAKIGLPTAN